MDQKRVAHNESFKKQATKNSVPPIVIEKCRLIKRIEKVFWSRK